jgi:hypothetical protein
MNKDAMPPRLRMLGCKKKMLKQAAWKAEKAR